MKPNLIAKRNQSQLVVVDMQERLVNAMPEEAMRNVAKNCNILLQSAVLLDVPSLYTEQYPQGLGGTLPELTPSLSSKTRVEKLTFPVAMS